MCKNINTANKPMHDTIVNESAIVENVIAILNAWPILISVPMIRFNHGFIGNLNFRWSSTWRRSQWRRTVLLRCTTADYCWSIAWTPVRRPAVLGRPWRVRHCDPTTARTFSARCSAVYEESTCWTQCACQSLDRDESRIARCRWLPVLAPQWPVRRPRWHRQTNAAMPEISIKVGLERCKSSPTVKWSSEFLRTRGHQPLTSAYVYSYHPKSNAIVYVQSFDW